MSNLTNQKQSSKQPTSDGSGLFGSAIRTFFRGLAAILPLALTAWLIHWAVTTGEQLLRGVILIWLPPEQYWTGMGFVLSIALVFVIGFLMYSFVIRQIYRRFTNLLERIPVIKSVYGMFADVARLVSSEERPFQKVVLVKLPEGMEQIGFLTRDSFDDYQGIGDGKVAVYLPMSYQLGGFTVIVAADAVKELSMSVEDALRFCLTAGVSRKGEPGSSAVPVEKP